MPPSAALGERRRYSPFSILRAESTHAIKYKLQICWHKWKVNPWTSPCQAEGLTMTVFWNTSKFHSGMGMTKWQHDLWTTGTHGQQKIRDPSSNFPLYLLVFDDDNVDDDYLLKMIAVCTMCILMKNRPHRTRDRLINNIIEHRVSSTSLQVHKNIVRFLQSKILCTNWLNVVKSPIKLYAFNFNIIYTRNWDRKGISAFLGNLIYEVHLHMKWD